MSVPTTQLLSMTQAAAAVGWSGKNLPQRMARMLVARERQTGKRIMTRLGGTKKPRLRVTLSALRLYCPELFRSKVDELSENLREFFDEIDDRIATAAAAHVTEHVEPKLGELWRRDEQLAEAIGGIANRLKLHVKLSLGKPAD